MKPLMGILVALYASSHILKTLINVDLHYFFMVIILIFYSSKNVLKLENLEFKFNKIYTFLFILIFELFIYAIITLIIFHNKSSISAFIELVLVLMFFLIGKNFKTVDYKYFFSILILLSSLQAAILLVNRNYIYSNLNNYLLVTLILGVVTCLLFVKIFERQKIILRFFWMGLYFLHIFAVLNMQSRGPAIFAFIFSVLYPVFIVKKKKLLIYLPVFVISSFLLMNYMYQIYEDSILFDRMNFLLTNFKDEPRFETYSMYFNSMKTMWFSGFGIGQSSIGIYGRLNDYPHNFILEFGSEFGIIGFSFIITFIIYTFFRKKVFLEKEKIYYKMSLVFYLYMFFSFFKSFGIYDSYLLFLSFGFLWSFTEKDLQRRTEYAVK